MHKNEPNACDFFTIPVPVFVINLSGLSSRYRYRFILLSIPPPPLPKKFLSAPVGWGGTLPCQNRAFTEQLSLTALIYIDTGAHARHFLREKNMYWLNLFVCV